MSESTKKRINYNQDVLGILAKRYDYSTSYIKAALRGDRVGTMPDVLIKEYKRLEKEAETIKENAKRQLEEKAANLNI
ncbi:hypothetical protein PG913_08430 [Tenacibaculum pacificus]|uniref:hypothetical protein n=1 Tax=Tenacibaculum TaxID=104267 RepID=UPI0022F3BB5C|nr:hypothetical protein [Tenacibaculum pacificus]WBX72928.1 hypothetical protein PG913_08430 [Tenacibaculum pacificus]